MAAATVMYLVLPVCLPGIEGNEDRVVEGEFIPNQIVAMHESFFGRTMIYYANGQPFLIDLTPDEYKVQRQSYYEQVEDEIKKAQSRIHKISKQ